VKSEEDSSPASKHSEEHHVILQKPISCRLLKSETTRQGVILESSGKVELTGANGARHLIDSHTKRVNHEAGHEDTVVQRTDEFTDASDSAPTYTDVRTIITSTKYGELKAGMRLDEVVVQIFDMSGGKTFPSLTVKVPVLNPYEGLSDQELVDRVLSEKFESR
jgi:hypothetical protein